MRENRPESAGDRSKVVSLNRPRPNQIKVERTSGVEKRPGGLSLAIGVVVYNNSAEQLGRLFTSVRRAGDLCGRLLGDEPVNVWFFIFNNGGPVSALEEYGFMGVDRFSAGENVGFGAGHNKMMQEAFSRGFDLYVGVNPDGVMHPHCLAELVKLSRRYEDGAR